MIFRKVIEIKKPDRLYDRGDRLTLWGSCFSTRLRDYLMGALYDVTDSPYGIIYNPLSMAQGMGRLLLDDAPREDELILRDGRWHSMMHHGAFSHSSKVVALQQMRAAFERSRAALQETNLLILTFGTAWVYERQGEVVNNCHKLPTEDFTRRRLSIDEIVSVWGRLIPALTEQIPDIRILLTVSPIPHYRDGAHESRLSKAILLLAAERLTELFPDRVSYFPSYEIMQDELRDYRFYDRDMAHPSDQAAEYIIERFREYYLREESGPALQKWEKVRKQLNHRPLTDSRESLRAYYDSLLSTLLEIRAELPRDYLDHEVQRIQEIRSHYL
ncbi:GSCFA domain-containing protein [uncultured Porphyromonas sp.]|uniref:GSCFA domain-containing protein n=1 Tax=uncultured Porphyromonas sp. TaxID=159274 RepID=UPI0026081E30|nr:GSCFA domain-containing protein [uncultured Porphyromonas sp.]